MSSCQLTSEGALLIINKLRDNIKLHSIHLGQNKIDDKCVIQLSHVLQQGSRLRYLNLSNNRISDAGAKALADMLQHNSSLQSLSLWCNCLTNLSAEYFADSFSTSFRHYYGFFQSLKRNNETLTYLCLDGNGIVDKKNEDIINQVIECNRSDEKEIDSFRYGDMEFKRCNFSYDTWEFRAR